MYKFWQRNTSHRLEERDCVVYAMSDFFCCLPVADSLPSPTLKMNPQVTIEQSPGQVYTDQALEEPIGAKPQISMLDLHHDWNLGSHHQAMDQRYPPPPCPTTQAHTKIVEGLSGCWLIWNC